MTKLRVLILAPALALAATAAPALAKKCESCPKVEDPAAAALPRSFASKPAVGTKARCAVSGEAITVTRKTLMAQYKGRWYVFCCGDCKPDFEANPQKFADKA